MFTALLMLLATVCLGVAYYLRRFGFE